MKRIFSLAMAAVFALSAMPVAYAADTQDYTMGTAVSYNAEDPDGDGVANNKESYTITVPAKLVPGGSGTVTLAGTWAVDRYVTVTASKEVEMVNDINSADTKTLAVTFDGIGKRGSNTTALTVTEQIYVADFDSKPLFGEWSGLIEYNAEIETRIVDLAGTSWQMKNIVTNSDNIISSGYIATQPTMDVLIDGQTLQNAYFYNFTSEFGVAIRHYSNNGAVAPVCLSGETAAICGLEEGWYTYDSQTYFDFENNRGATFEDVILSAQKCNAPTVSFYDIEEEYLHNLDVIDWLYDNAVMQ